MLLNFIVYNYCTWWRHLSRVYPLPPLLFALSIQFSHKQNSECTSDTPKQELLRWIPEIDFYTSILLIRGGVVVRYIWNLCSNHSIKQYSITATIMYFPNAYLKVMDLLVSALLLWPVLQSAASAQRWGGNLWTSQELYWLPEQCVFNP